MISLTRFETATQKIVNDMEIRGLSTEEKPTDKVDDIPIINGAKYIEVDTGKVCYFDAESETWSEGV